MKGKSLITLKDLSADEIRFLLDEAKNFKENREKIVQKRLMEGKTLGMIFEKRSTRTRVSTEAAMAELGGHALFLGKDDIQLGVNESLSDTAKVLGRMVTGVLARVFDHQTVEILAKHSGIPVINALSDRFHPLQGLADILTIEEHLGKLEGIKVAWVGDGNNVCHQPDQDVIDYCKKNESTSNQIIYTNNPIEAVKRANVVVTDTFISMGEEAETLEKLRKFESFQVNLNMVKEADKNFIFMHCLPRHKEEVTDDVIYGEHSVVFDEAENRLHTVAAVLKNLL
jgi:ornithine carbamoyltransferase